MVGVGTKSWARENPDGCRRECSAEAEGFLRECRESGGKECEALAAKIEADCIAKWCEPPPPPTCEDACEEEAGAAFRDWASIPYSNILQELTTTNAENMTNCHEADKVG